MRIRNVFIVVAMLAGTGLTGVASAPPAVADHGQPPLDPTKMEYQPIGYYGPADEQTVAGSTTVPLPGDPPGPPFIDDPNPTGKFIAYDRNVWESLTMPSRHPGDNCTEVGGPLDQCREGDLDPDHDRSNYSRHDDGSSSVPGTCPPHPEFVPWGMCDNNQLEYLDYYENEMETEFADLGLIIKRYPFQSTGGGTPRGTYLAAAGGQAYNIAAIIPGADHPDETVIVGAHYDFTDSGPAAAWDSAEGHTEIMRMAWLMADYYRETNTRPSATIKFIPWDSEESGSQGSLDYVTNNIPPGEEDKVRGYFNVDPCAGAYPAFEEGTNRQVDQILQLANPASFESQPEVKARIEAFNATAEQVIGQVLDRLDDTTTRPGGTEVPIFVSDAEADADGPGGLQTDRDDIVTALGGLALFGSDYTNFQNQGIPIFNFFPDYFGPHADTSPSDGGAKGLEILHTNNDNLQRINRLTSANTGTGAATVIDPTGNSASEGWAQGMEFCAQIEAWGMLQPTQAGTQTANNDVVSYFEAMPNEAIVKQVVNFDATGTYQYANFPTDRSKRPESAFSYEWDFGDGTTGTGKVVQHAYQEVGRYNATLTVNGAGGSSDQMTIPITVEGSNFAPPILDAIQPEDAKDGNFELNWEFEADRAGFQHFSVEESFDYQGLLVDDASDINANWNVTPPPPGLEPWQHSDSETEKFLGNQFRSEPRSFWTGVTPEHFQDYPLGARSIMTLKNPIHIPEDSETELSYWSKYLNQSSDSAQVQVALTAPGVAPEDLDWDVVDSFQDADNTCVGTNPTFPLNEFEHRKIDLGRFAGKDILIRFVFTLSAANPALSHPCGWYVDDIALFGGTFNEIDTTTSQQYLVLDRPNHTWAYRIKGIYNDGIPTAPSNIEVANVTNSRDIPKKDLLRCLRIKGKHILGSVGKDNLVGTDGPEVICGFAGKDRITALGGDDHGLGFKGKDRVRGGDDADRLFGDQSNDRVAGGKGKDRLKGGKGKDRLNGGAGKDRCGNSKKDRQRKC